MITRFYNNTFNSCAARFARESHDAAAMMSASATAQTFNPRRPRSSSRPMIRNVMITAGAAATQEFDDDGGGGDDPAAVYTYHHIIIYAVMAHARVYNGSQGRSTASATPEIYAPITYSYAIRTINIHVCTRCICCTRIR